jgi:hypothetical protein
MPTKKKALPTIHIDEHFLADYYAPVRLNLLQESPKKNKKA